MTDYQDALVLENLDLVNWVIRTRISVPNRPLLTYDDFYAIGCEAICRAALKYQADSGEFAPFACRYMQNFEDYLCERNDTIDNAAYQLIGVLTAEDPGASLEDDPATPNWDMAIIGEVVDAVKEIIIEKVGYTCHPFYCDEVPCYLTDECDNKHCPLRRHDVEDKEKADEEKSRF